MPVQRVLISSKSGDVIPDGTGARIRIMWNDESRVDMRADLTDAEADEVVAQYRATDVEPRPDRRRRH